MIHKTLTDQFRKKADSKNTKLWLDIEVCYYYRRSTDH